jgi:hypothetical protein
MCRIALFNKEGFNLFGHELPSLPEFLSFLEVQRGGHGNGFAVKTQSGDIVLDKGLPRTHTPIYCAEKMIQLAPEASWFLFHTRKASESLPVVESQVQPFAAGHYVLCMNGTEKDLMPMASETGLSDTQLILIDIASRDLPPVFLLKNTSNFAGFYEGIPFLVKNSGVDMSLYYEEQSNAIIFASEFPDGVHCLTVPDIFYWDETKPIKSLII